MNFVLAKSVLFEFFRVKSPRCLLVVVAASLVLSLSGPASADESGYRSGQRFIEHPPVSIKTGLTDGQTTLSPGSYRVRVRAGRLVFADAEMRQVVLRAPCKFAVLTSNLRAPKITQKKLGTTWRIEYAYRAWRCAVTLRESSAKPDTPQLARTLPELTKIKRPISSGVYDEPDSYELATRLLEQRALELKPCLLTCGAQGDAPSGRRSHEMYVLIELRMEASPCRKASRSCTSCGTLSFWPFICSESRRASKRVSSMDWAWTG